MKMCTVFYGCLMLLLACGSKTERRPSIQRTAVRAISTSTHSIVPTNTVATRFPAPRGYERVTVSTGSFAAYLRYFPLKPKGKPVLLYNNQQKYNQNIHAAVLNIDTGKRDLQQCADAIMRLRAEYLWKQKQYNAIHFNFTSGDRIDYKKWRQGYRVRVQGNQVNYQLTAPIDDSYETFRKYLNTIFTYAGTLSLEKELHSKDITQIAAGDVFIQGGSPGHAVIVMDVARNQHTGKTVFLLAQSYMPAQDIHLLKNPRHPQGSPWYDADIREVLHTPEWSFSRHDLKTW